MRAHCLTTLVATLSIFFATSCGQAESGMSADQGGATATASKVDPICKMSIDPAKAAASVEQAGETYYFCSEHCKEEFSKDPEKYLGKK